MRVLAGWLATGWLLAGWLAGWLAGCSYSHGLLDWPLQHVGLFALAGELANFALPYLRYIDIVYH